MEDKVLFDFPCSPSFREYEQWLIGNGLYSREEPEIRYRTKEKIKVIPLRIPRKSKRYEEYIDA